jgi:four helix bundle protein
MTRDYDDRDFDVQDGPAGAPDDRGTDRMDDRDEGGGTEDDRGGRGRPRIDSFEKMKVWQEAHQLTMKVFAATPKLPSEQQAGLALQMETAAVNVPKSIAEGFKRRGPRNKAHFYNIAQTSLEGLRYYFILCRDLGFDIPFEDLSYRGDQVARMLDGLVRSMLR